MRQRYPTPVWRTVLPAFAAVLAWAVLSMHGLAPYTHDLLAGAHHAAPAAILDAEPSTASDHPEHAGAAGHGASAGHAERGVVGGVGVALGSGTGHLGGHPAAHLAACCLVIFGGGLVLLHAARVRAERIRWFDLAHRVVSPRIAYLPNPPSLVELSVSRT